MAGPLGQLPVRPRPTRCWARALLAPLLAIRSQHIHNIPQQEQPAPGPQALQHPAERWLHRPDRGLIADSSRTLADCGIALVDRGGAALDCPTLHRLHYPLDDVYSRQPATGCDLKRFVDEHEHQLPETWLW